MIEMYRALVATAGPESRMKAMSSLANLLIPDRELWEVEQRRKGLAVMRKYQDNVFLLTGKRSELRMEIGDR